MPAPRISVFIITLAFGMVLAACGKTGPLYLPSELANELSEQGSTGLESDELPTAGNAGKIPEQQSE